MVTRGLLTVFQQRKSADREAVVSSPVGPEEEPSRRERLRGVNDIVGGVFSLVIVWDRSIERHERFRLGTLGAASVVAGVGRLRQQRPVMAIAGMGYLVALGSAAVTAVRKRRR